MKLTVFGEGSLNLSNETTNIEDDVKDLAEKLNEAESEAREIRERLKVVEGLQADVREQETLEANIADGTREEAALVLQLKSLLSTGWRSLSAQMLAHSLADIRHKNFRSRSTQSKHFKCPFPSSSSQGSFPRRPLSDLQTVASSTRSGD